MSELFFVFDVESLGLHGYGFAYGFVVVDREGVEQASGYAAIPPDLAGLGEDDANFLRQNVLPNLYGYTHTKWEDLQFSFWNEWRSWSQAGAMMVTDCGWPVEANFLSACIAADPEGRKDGPYPLLDVSSILFAAGKDPVGTFERRAGEMPAHNPLCDARQSARVFIETLNSLKDAPTEAGR